MPLLFQYLLKLSCSLAVVYFFYQLALRRLTFYTSNRWYLFGYSALSLFIPAVNISSLLEGHSPQASLIVRLIPSVAQYTSKTSAITEPALPYTLDVWNGMLLVLSAGMLVLLARLVVQYLSYRKLKRSAKLVTDDGVKLYQVTKSILPFSFGRSIFINQQSHSEAELKEIIRHEFVHVRQRHTVDIVWAELLCILNWYNPFAWMLRHAVRQNLEFIADNNVLQSGIDKKQYQYLLLKVIGAPQFRIATQFNFSSLKKRIIMINKLPSAKAHLVKFLLAVPLVFVLLVSFRNTATRKRTDQKAGNTITISKPVDAAINNNSFLGHNSPDTIKPGHKEIIDRSEQVKDDDDTGKQLKGESAGSEKPYRVIDGKSFVVGRSAWAITKEFTDVIFVDGKRMMPDELNKTIKKNSIVAVGTVDGEPAKEKYGTAQPVFEIYINTRPKTDWTQLTLAKEKEAKVHELESNEVLLKEEEQKNTEMKQLYNLQRQLAMQGKELQEPGQMMQTQMPEEMARQQKHEVAEAQLLFKEGEARGKEQNAIMNVVKPELFKDGFIQEGEYYELMIDSREMLLNGKKQAASIHQKYIELISNKRNRAFSDKEQWSIKVL